MTSIPTGNPGPSVQSARHHETAPRDGMLPAPAAADPSDHAVPDRDAPPAPNAPPVPETVPAAPAADSIRWSVEGFTPESPFTAALALTDGVVDAWVDLTPATITALQDALAAVVAAQRAAVLGHPDPTPEDTPGDAPDPTVTDRAEAKASHRNTTLKIVAVTAGVILFLYVLSVGAIYL